MYVILRGAVEVRAWNKQLEKEVVLTTMSDGEHFGDVSFLQSQLKGQGNDDRIHKRYSTITSIEDCYLCEIPAEIVMKTFRMSSVNVDLDSRVDFMS